MNRRTRPEQVITSPYLRYGNGVVWDGFADRLWTALEIPSVGPETIFPMLDRCRSPVAIGHLVRDVPTETCLDRLLERRWLMDPEGVWATFNIRHLEIETTTHCNWRCKCCPVSLDPKPKATMPMSLFEHIIAQAGTLGTVVDATLNAYNEPTLDPFFVDRVEALANAGLGLRLHTNGSGLTEKKLECLARLGNTVAIVFNFPSLDEQRFEQLAGAKTFRQSRRAVDSAIARGLPVRFSVNGTEQEQAENLPSIRQTYESSVGAIDAWPTGNRVGLLAGYGDDVPITGSLSGCHLVMNWVHFSVTGDLFICCEDYYQDSVYGNIRDDELATLLRSPAAQEMRRKVFGAEDAPEDYICRRCDTMRARQEKERDLFGEWNAV